MQPSCSASVLVTGSTVTNNDSSNNTATNGEGFGVFDGSTGARLDSNTADSNTTNGFFADSTTSENVFSNNDARGNRMFDCQDQSHGTGTDATANFWIRDQGVTSDPMGICRAKEHGHGHGDGHDGRQHPDESN